MTMKSSQQDVFSLEDQVKLFDKLSPAARIRLIKSLPREQLDQLDGKSFINMSSSARTNLGRLLQSTSHTPFNHINYGRFASIEGFWWWIKSAERDDRLRTVSGKSARQLGKTFTSKPVKDFKVFVIRALWAKVTQNRVLLKSFTANTKTPIVSFYYSGDMNVPTVDPATVWVVKALEIMRDYLATVGLESAKFEEIEDYIHQCVQNTETDPVRGKKDQKKTRAQAIPASWQDALRIKRAAELAKKPKVEREATSVDIPKHPVEVQAVEVAVLTTAGAPAGKATLINNDWSGVTPEEAPAESTSPVDEALAEDEVICGGSANEEPVPTNEPGVEVPQDTANIQS